MRINLNNISLFGYHGLYEKEINDGQDFKIDISIKLRKRKNITDDIEDSVDYANIATIVEMVFNKRRYNLIESLASDIADEVLLNSMIKSVIISIKKTNPPIDIDVESVEVIIKK